MKKQSGLSMVGFIVVSVLVIAIAIIGMKVTPSVIEYFTILKTIKTLASSSEGQGTVADIRKSFEKRASVDDITSVTAADLDVSKEGNQVVISFEYSKKINLIGNVSLCIDFAGNSSGSKRIIE